MKPLPGHGPCYICGPENPKGLGLQLYLDDEKVIHGETTLTLHEQGPPNMAHGGASAAILDEAMGAAVWSSGLMVAAVNLNVNFRKPVPLGVEIKVRAMVVERKGRRIHTRSEIVLPDGRVAVEATGIFVEAHHLFNSPDSTSTEESDA